MYYDMQSVFSMVVRDFRGWGLEVKFQKDVEVEDVISTGSFAVVYKGVLKGKHQVAIKKLLNMMGAPMTIKMILDFKSEISFLKDFHHPNIVGILATSCNPLCVMLEYCARGTLFSICHPEGFFFTAFFLNL